MPLIDSRLPRARRLKLGSSPSRRSSLKLRPYSVFVPVNLANTNEIVVKESYAGRIIPINNPAVISYIQSESANVDMISDVMEFGKRNMQVLENGNVQLFDESGASLIMSPEKYIKDEIMEWAKKQY